MASFLVFACLVSSFNAKSADLNLEQERRLKALLHYQGNNSAIPDLNFILSGEEFSIQREVEASLAFFQRSKKNLCSLPARALYLSSKGFMSKPDFSHCDELNEYLKSVPFDQITLVFSAENLSQPSSMMGHILLKVAGNNVKGTYVEHGVSFFTTLDSMNVPKIIWDTTIVGKPGYFSLTPYSEKLQQYLIEEQRNVLEYHLAASDFEKQLLQLHIWELKDKNYDYFFTKYNCATLTRNLLSVLKPSMYDDSIQWLTPLDVVKSANLQSDFITDVEITPSTNWTVRMLTEATGEFLSGRDVEHIIHSATQSKLKLPVLDQQQSFLALELVKYINEFRFDNKEYDNTVFTTIRDEVNESLSHLPDFNYEFQQYKNPLLRQADSQVMISRRQNRNSNQLLLRYTPASHTIMNDNRQLFAESELRLTELTLAADLNSGKTTIDAFHLYSMSTYTPYNPYTGGLSGGLSIRYDDFQFAPKLKQKQLIVEGELGISYQASNDVLIFALLGSSFSSDFQTDPEINLTPRIGAIIYEIFDMKSYISVSAPSNLTGNNKHHWRYDLQQAISINDSWQLRAEVSMVENSNEFERSVNVGISYIF